MVMASCAVLHARVLRGDNAQQPSDSDAQAGSPVGHVVRFGSTFLRHPPRVSAIAISPSGELLASANSGPCREVRLWDLRNRTQAWAFPLCAEGPVGGIAFLKDGSRLVVATSKVVVVDFEKRTLAAEMEGHSLITSLALCPVSQRLATGHTGGAIRLWDLATRTSTLLTAEGQGRVEALAFSPDGETVSAALGDRGAWQWEVKTATLVRTIERWRATAVAYSSDGERLSVAAGELKGEIGTWRTTPFQEMPLSRTMNGSIAAMAYSLQNDWLAALGGHVSRDLILWQSTAREEWARRATYGDDQLALFPSGNRLATAGSSSQISLWHIHPDGPTRINDDSHAGEVDELWFSDDSRQIVSCDRDSGIRCWELDTGKSEILVTKHEERPVQAVFATKAQRFLAYDNRNIVIRSSRDAQVLFRAPFVTNMMIEDMAISPDGMFAVVSDSDGAMYVWRPGTGAPVRRVRLNGGLAVAVSPDGTTVAAAGRDGSVDWWSSKDWSFLKTTLLARAHPRWMRFSPCGRFLAVLTPDFECIVWDRATSREVFRLAEVHSTTVDFSHDSQWIAVGTENFASNERIVRLHRVDTGKAVRTLTGHRDDITAIRFSRHSEWLAAGATDTTILLWNVKDMKASQ